MIAGPDHNAARLQRPVDNVARFEILATLQQPIHQHVAAWSAKGRLDRAAAHVGANANAQEAPDVSRLHRRLSTGSNLGHRLGDAVEGTWNEIRRLVRGGRAAPAQVRLEVAVRPLRRDVDRQRAGDDRNRLHGRTSRQGPGND